MIAFRCPSCSTEIAVPDGYAGRAARCPTCGSRIRVPRRAAESGAIEDLDGLDESTTSSAIFRMGGRTYAVRPRLEGMLLVAAAVTALSAGAFVAVGLLARVYAPWFLAGLVAAGFALFGGLLVLPAYSGIRRSRGRKTGQRLAFVIVAASAALCVVYLAAGLISRAMGDHATCPARLRAVHQALVAYAAAHGGALPPQPETLVEQGLLPASKLTCPHVPGVREGAPTYMPRSWRRYASGESVIDLRTDVPAFPPELIILIDRGVTDVRVEGTDRTVRGHYVLTLGGEVRHVEVVELAEALSLQKAVIDRVLAERLVDRQQRESAAGGAEPGEPPPPEEAGAGDGAAGGGEEP
jgi:predicted Zn finger-like uncharacterized protein